MEYKTHQLTDKMLLNLEKALKKQYATTFIKLKREINDVVGEMDLSKAKTPIERYNLSLKYNRLAKLEKDIPIILNETNKLAIKEVNKMLLDVYKVNYKDSLDVLSVLLAITIPNKFEKPKNVSEKVDEEKSPFDTLAIDDVKDITELRANIKRQFVTSVMNGENPSEMVKRIQRVTEAKISDIVRIARTETTRIENSARQDTYEQVAKEGHIITKKWVCVNDSRTRPAHKDPKLLNVEVDFDKPFIVDGEKLMFPGDKNGSAKNVINCRCMMIAGTKKIKK